MQNEKKQVEIFINYRRVPAKSDALNIQTELEKHFGSGSVFLDIKDIEPGDYWAQNIQSGLEQARVLLVLLHSNWLHAQDPKSGMRRLDQEHDWVRKEIAYFLDAAKNGADKITIPVLLGEGTTSPEKDFLPEAIRGLAACQNSCRIRIENISYDILQLVDTIKKRGIAAVAEPGSPGSPPAILDQLHPLPELSLSEARRTLPAPYIGLRYFEEKEAHIYFGRDEDVFQLINRIRQPGYGLCLLFGPSGVGKSSLLHAGLLPRLRRQYYIPDPYRRSFERGLDLQLTEALAQTHAAAHPKPALIILDQVEEMFTHYNPQRPHEARDFFNQLIPAVREHDGALRFLLSFRFEHFTSIVKPLEEAGLAFLKMEIEPLKLPAVRQAITGVLDRPPLPEHFGLQIEKELIETMVEAVCKDKASNIAPLLQLQLTSLWDEAFRLDQDAPRFERNLYKRFEKDSLPQMLEYLLNRLPDAWKPALDNGLVLGLLHRFVTPRGTAGFARTDHLLSAYCHIPDFDGLLQALQDVYLLIAQPNGYRLAHDSLAPIVLDKYQSSDLPGQRAARIIETKARDHQRGYDLAFSEVDLEIVRAGQAGMPTIDPGLLARIEQDEARYRSEREQRFRLAFDAAEKAVEHLDYNKALNDLQVAAGYGIHPDEVLVLARTLPFVFAIERKEVEWRESLALIQRVAQDDNASPWMRAATPQAFLQDLTTHDAALWQAMQQRHFPALLPIRGGTYSMGSTEGYADEKPVHTVTVDDFLLADTPVTFWQYGLFCLLTGRNLPSDSGFGRGDRPVININWLDAAAYCNWLSEREGLEKVYADERDDDDLPADFTRNGYRLPTEAEWEYAAGGGAENRSRFGNGKDIADPAEMNFDASHPYNQQYNPDWYVPGKGRGATTSVRMFAPNALGLHDMSGNVNEWCQDWWSEGADHFYAQSEDAHNPLGPDSGDYRVVRGGSWDNVAYVCRVSFRVRVHPLVRNSDIGFRVSRRL